MKKRVVVTGLGAITPIGNSAEEFWSNAKKGVCGIDVIRSFDIENAKFKVAAEVNNFSPGEHFGRRQVNRLDRFSHLGIVAAKEAYEDAGLCKAELDRNRLGVIIGNGVGGITTVMEEAVNLDKGGLNMVSPLLVPKSIPNIASGNIAIALDARGVNKTVNTACASGTDAIGEAFRAIEYGDADIILAGGCEACINSLMMAGFVNLKALSTSDDPQRASIPFDKERGGFVMGEGAGVLVLEELEHALTRGSKIYAEIVGYGNSCDAYHLTSPSPEGEGGARAMELALKNASIKPESISYINAHGTSTPYNDAVETKAIKSAFGANAYRVPISSTKSMIGHLLGAAGAVEGIACVKSLEDDFIHGTIGYQIEDEKCDLDYVAGTGRKMELKYIMSNSFGFGGHNASLIFKKYE